MAESESPLRFSPGARTRPAAMVEETPPQQSPERSNQQPPPDEGQPNDQAPDTSPRGIRERVERIRQLAAGKNRPLGSPEGPAHRARPERSSRGSSDERRVVDGTAVVIRQVSTWIDWAGARYRPGADFVATAEECYAIASPLAGYILDRIPDEGPLAEVAERAGLLGAAIGVVTWFGRAVFGRPGGRAESEALHERVVDRLRRTRQKGADVVRETTDQESGESEAAPRYSEMIGVEDVGPV